MRNSEQKKRFYHISKKHIFLISAKAVIENRGKILLLRNTMGECGGKTEWELPGGLIEMGEALAQGIRREIREETGLAVHVGKLIAAHQYWRKNFYLRDGRKFDARIIELVYVCKKTGGKIRLSHEHDVFRWVFSKRLPKLAYIANARIALAAYQKAIRSEK